MIDKLVSQYIERMTTDDISKFALDNGLSFNNKELTFIYNLLKDEWRTIIYGNPRIILDDLKAKFDLFTYQKIEKLYVDFREKYQAYL